MIDSQQPNQSHTLGEPRMIDTTACINQCFTPRLTCPFNTGRHRCTHQNSLHSGLCSCRCGLKWDPEAIMIPPQP